MFGEVFIFCIIKQLDSPNIKSCYKAYFPIRNIWRYHQKPYLCTVFFIVLDLRLTKVGVRRDSFFFARIPKASKAIH